MKKIIRQSATAPSFKESTGMMKRKVRDWLLYWTIHVCPLTPLSFCKALACTPEWSDLRRLVSKIKDGECQDYDSAQNIVSEGHKIMQKTNISPDMRAYSDMMLMQKSIKRWFEFFRLEKEGS